MEGRETKLRWFQHSYINSDTLFNFFVFKDAITKEHTFNGPRPFHHMVVYDEQKDSFVPLNLYDSNLVESQGNNRQLLKSIFLKIKDLENTVLLCYPEQNNQKIVNVI